MSKRGDTVPGWIRGAVDQGAKVVTLSDSGGFIHDADGLTQEKIDWVRDHKSKSGASLEAYAKEFDNIKHFLSGKALTFKSIKEHYKGYKKTASKEQWAAAERGFITKFTYDTSRIEGSTLTYSDTRLLLEDGISPKHKPLKDIRESG